MAPGRNAAWPGLKRSAVTFALVLGCLLAVVPLFQEFSLRLVYNASPSIPKGFYWITKMQSVSVGDLVVAKLPEHVRELAKERGYLPEGVLLIKPVVAGPDDWVCHKGGWLHINKAVPTNVPKIDSRGRRMPQWGGCRRLMGNEYFLLLPHVPMSFDSRYFGPVKHTDIVGKATRFF